MQGEACLKTGARWPRTRSFTHVVGHPYIVIRWKKQFRHAGQCFMQRLIGLLSMCCAGSSESCFAGTAVLLLIAVALFSRKIFCVTAFFCYFFCVLLYFLACLLL